MYKFKITGVTIENYKLDVKFENLETKEKCEIAIPKFNFYFSELEIIRYRMQMQFPDNLTFTVESLNSTKILDGVCNSLKEFIYKPI